MNLWQYSLVALRRAISLARFRANTHPEYLWSYGLQSQAYAKASYTPKCQIALIPLFPQGNRIKFWVALWDSLYETFAWQLACVLFINTLCNRELFYIFGRQKQYNNPPMAYQSKKTDLSMWHLQTHSFQSVITKRKTTTSIRLTGLLIGVRFGRWSTRNTRSDKMLSAPRLMTWFSYSTRVRPKQPAGKRCVQSPQRCWWKVFCRRRRKRPKPITDW